MYSIMIAVGFIYANIIIYLCFKVPSVKPIRLMVKDACTAPSLTLFDAWSKTISASVFAPCRVGITITFCICKLHFVLYSLAAHDENWDVRSAKAAYSLYQHLHTLCNLNLDAIWFRLLEQGQHSDVKFLVHGQIFTAHRCILSARSEYFTDMFETKWKGRSLITLKHPLVDDYTHKYISSVLS